MPPGDSEHVITGGARRWPLFPRFPEPISPEFYRQTGKLRFLCLVFLLVINVASTTQAESFHLDLDVYWLTFWLTLPFWLGDIAANALIWKAALSVRAMRRLVLISVVLEAIAILIHMQVAGTVNSHVGIMVLAGVAVYRIAFDFTVGATVFSIMLGGQWGLVIAETQGWITAQPLRIGPPDHVYGAASREIHAMIFLTGSYIFLFLFANWAVARMRHKDLAIRILRESLYAVEGARVGQHTGRNLRNTYTIGELIGVGGMGEVYEGRHERTQRRVAIKLLHPHLITDPTLLRRFRREAEITGRLGSQHIVEVIDVDEDDGQPFLVLEYLEGENLDDRIRRSGPLSPEVASDFLAQLCHGLTVAHEAGVVHRDLKPENVFLCPIDDGGERVKILDFGVSKIRGSATAITHEVALIGTPDFMAPEQAIGDLARLDRRTDIFAAGAISYFTLTGRRPFHATSVPALLRKICDEEPVPITVARPSLPAGIGNVLAIAMAKEMGERYDSAAELARDLRAALDGEMDAKLAARAAAVWRGTPASPSAVVRVDDSTSPAADTIASSRVDGAQESASAKTLLAETPRSGD